MAGVEIKFDFADVSSKLDQIADNFRKMEMLEAGARAALVPVKDAATRITPAPGYPGYNYPSKGSARLKRKRLRDTIGIKTKVYAQSKQLVAVVGPQYPAGSHGHLVELGHRIVTGGSVRRIGRWAKKGIPAAGKRTGMGRVGGMAKAKPFLAPAVDATRNQVDGLFAATVSRRVDAEIKRLATNG